MAKIRRRGSNGVGHTPLKTLAATSSHPQGKFPAPLLILLCPFLPLPTFDRARFAVSRSPPKYTTESERIIDSPNYRTFITGGQKVDGGACPSIRSSKSAADRLSTQQLSPFHNPGSLHIYPIPSSPPSLLSDSRPRWTDRCQTCHLIGM